MILERAPVGIALLDFDRTVRYCNPEFLKIYGWDGSDILGTRLPIPDHQRKNYLDILEDLRGGRSIVDIETVRVRRDGREFYARISAAPVTDATGRVDGYIAIITVGDENHSDQLEVRNLEFLVQSASDFMCVADLNMRVAFINDPGKAMIGIAHEAEVNGRQLVDLFADDCRSRLTEIFHSLRPAEAGILTQMHLKNIATGKLTPVSASLYMVNDPHTGEPISIGCVAKILEVHNGLDEPREIDGEAFKTLLRQIPVGVLLVDPAGRPIDSNSAFQELLGYTAEEIVTIPFSKHVHPDDLAHGRSLFLQLIAGGIGSYEINKRLLHRSGQIVPTRMKVHLIRDSEGRPKHTISIVNRASESQSDALDSTDPREGTTRETPRGCALCQYPG
jgi:PAS domain S-box-containing protein